MFNDLSEGMYYNLFCTYCDPDMKIKLSSVRGIEKMKPAEIWEQVELMFLHSNPLYTRRIQAMKTNILKGETVSDYLIRLKGAFSEADMAKASIGTIMISLLIANLPADGSEGKIKQDLLKLFQENPNLSEEDLCLFSNKIKEVESLGLACEYRNIDTGRGGQVCIRDKER